MSVDWELKYERLRAEAAAQLAAKDKEIARLRDALEKIEPEARRYATMYPEGSDGRNTFTLFAEWAERTTRAALTEERG